MMLRCATSNAGKLREFRLAAARAGGAFEIEPVAGIEPCEETGTTFHDNAILKALHYSPHTAGYLFADDSGLAVEALADAPGVLSARFAGPDADDESNNALLLEKMRGVTDRRARFDCVVALARSGTLVRTFEATVEGDLLEAPRGRRGFGYDPLFYYPPFGCTLAEMDSEQKIEISHRGKAMRAMFEYLASLPG